MTKVASEFKMPDTGVTRCFDETGREIDRPKPGEPFYGQNGCFEIHPLAFTKLGAEGTDISDSSCWDDGFRMVRDNNTGLIWEVKSPRLGDINYVDDRYTWQEAQDVYVAELNRQEYGGFDDWRVPFKDELRSVVDYGRSGPAVDPRYFPHCKSDFYWTNAEYRMHPTLAWGIVFGLGSAIPHGKKMARHVRAVRGGADRAFGLAGTSRFKDNGDGTITDSITGLMWQKGENERMGWYEAMRKCQTLELAGHTDWRLPNIKELNTILNLDYTDGWWYYKYFFPADGLNPPLLHYYSSTPHENYYVWVTNFCFGYDGYYAGKNAPLLFRAVRNVKPFQAQKLDFKLPETGQRSFFDDEGNSIPAGTKGSRFYGQDGSHVTSPMSFFKLGEGGRPLSIEARWEDGLRMVRDENTGLVWEVKSPISSDVNYEDDRYNRADAEERFIAELNRKHYGGFSNWRLPNREELRSIVDYSGAVPAADNVFFADCAPEFYWAEQENGFDPRLNWGIYFGYGCAISYPKSNIYRVRAVRGGHCRAFGDPLRFAFKDNGDGTVTDLNTGLMWIKEESPDLTVEEALKYCETLSLAGHTDWRLPNIKEIATLVNPAFKDGLWFHKAVFPHVKIKPLGFYQSSSVYGGTFGWGVNFQFGYDGYYADRKRGRYPFRPVRDAGKW
jgi:hypothetical protein